MMPARPDVSVLVHDPSRDPRPRGVDAALIAARHAAELIREAGDEMGNAHWASGTPESRHTLVTLNSARVAVNAAMLAYERLVARERMTPR